MTVLECYQFVQRAPQCRAEVRIEKSSKKLIFEQSDGSIAWPANHQGDGNKRELAASAGEAAQEPANRSSGETAPKPWKDASVWMQYYWRKLSLIWRPLNVASKSFYHEISERMSDIKQQRWEVCFNLLTQSITRRRKVWPPWTTWHAKFKEPAKDCSWRLEADTFAENAQTWSFNCDNLSTGKLKS